MQIVIEIPEPMFDWFDNGFPNEEDAKKLWHLVKNGTPLTPDVLANALMEERIRGTLDSDITYSKDVIPDVKCKLTVSIQDHRPCYCGAELREVWRESEG